MATLTAIIERAPPPNSSLALTTTVTPGTLNLITPTLTQITQITPTTLTLTTRTKTKTRTTSETTTSTDSESSAESLPTQDAREDQDAPMTPTTRMTKTTPGLTDHDQRDSIATPNPAATTSQHLEMLPRVLMDSRALPGSMLSSEQLLKE